MQFDKYEATGNDFLLFKTLPNSPDLIAKKVCDRHFGIGADGLIAPVPSSKATIGMRYFNSDGSEAPMCGNGMRTFVRFLLNENIVDVKQFTVETKGGIIAITVHDDDTIALGLGDLTTRHDAPDVSEPTTLHDPITLNVNDRAYPIHITTLGTLHGVVFVTDYAGFDFHDVGHQLSTHPFFPRHININFVRIIDAENIEVRTYERGAGATLSCGTGVGASAALAHYIKGCQDTIAVEVPGGTLTVNVASTITLKGPAKHIATIAYKGAI